MSNPSSEERASHDPPRDEGKTLWEYVPWWQRVMMIVAAVGVGGIVVCGQWLQDQLQYDVFKTLVQLVVVGFLGGLGSLLFAEVTRARDHQETRLQREAQEHEAAVRRAAEKRADDLRREAEHTAEEVRQKAEQRAQVRMLQQAALRELTDVYNGVKGIRRLLDARALDAAGMVIGERYDALMQELDTLQLKIEYHKKLIENAPESYGILEQSDQTLLGWGLEGAEKYLRNIISEYQDNLRLFTGSPAVFPLSSLPRLAAFIGPSTGPGGVRKSFADNFGGLLSRLSQLIAS
jgi:hypothetical protein